MYDNKLIRCLLFLICLSLTGLATAQPVRFSLSEKAWLDRHQTLRVGVVELTPPLLFYAGGRNPQGLVADYLRVLVLQLGLQLEIVRYSDKQALLHGLREGEVDALAAWPAGLEADSKLGMTRPYLSLPLALYGTAHVPDSGLRGLRGKSLAVLKQSGLEGINKIFPGLRLVAVSTLEQGFEKAELGEVHAIFVDAASADYMLKRQSYDDLQKQLQMDLAYDLSMATLNSNSAVLGLLQKGLDRFAQDEMQEIWNRWPGVERPTHYASTISTWWLWLLFLLAWSGVLVWGVNRFVLHKEQQYNFKLKRAIRRLQRREKALKEKLIELNEKAREYQGQSRDQRQRLDLIDQVLPGAAWVWDPGQEQCQWDERMYGLFGQDPEAFDPTPEAILKQVHEEYRSGVAALFQRPEEESESRVSFRLELPDGGTRWLLDFSEYSADPASGEEHRVGLCWDVTDFVQENWVGRDGEPVES